MAYRQGNMAQNTDSADFAAEEEAVLRHGEGGFRRQLVFIFLICTLAFFVGPGIGIGALFIFFLVTAIRASSMTSELKRLAELDSFDFQQALKGYGYFNARAWTGAYARYRQSHTFNRIKSSSMSRAIWDRCLGRRLRTIQIIFPVVFFPVGIYLGGILYDEGMLSGLGPMGFWEGILLVLVLYAVTDVMACLLVALFTSVFSPVRRALDSLPRGSSRNGIEQSFLQGRALEFDRCLAVLGDRYLFLYDGSNFAVTEYRHIRSVNVRVVQRTLYQGKYKTYSGTWHDFHLDVTSNPGTHPASARTDTVTLDQFQIRILAEEILSKSPGCTLRDPVYEYENTYSSTAAAYRQHPLMAAVYETVSPDPD